MIILGISLGFNSSACVYSTTHGILAAISQERLNGQKNTKDLPLDAVLECCEVAGVTSIDRIAISHYEDITNSYFDRYGERYGLAAKIWKNKIISFLVNNDITIGNTNILRVPHHDAHKWSTVAFYKHPEADDYAITSDGFGDGFSATISTFGGDMLSTKKLEESVALVYQFVTGALGYKEHQHEGKITGLAAFGTPKYIDCFEDLNIDDVELTEEEQKQVKTSAIIDFDKFLKLKKTVYGLVKMLLEEGASPADIAASVQDYAENVTLKWVQANVTKGHNCYLAGGLFANVKINQRIKDMKTDNGESLFKNVYVCPAMGDEGTAVGAAVYCCIYEAEIVSPNQCGTVADETEVNHWFDVYCQNKDAYKIHKIEDDQQLAVWIAEQLSNNRIVCLVKGRMEFGPRALCHRSILYNCNTKETNTWLNDKLGRTEFMPFAPVCREEVADDLFLNLNGGRDSAKHMTMTFDCTDEFIQNYPAACHIDNTARPQIVSYNEDPFIWNVLERYENMTEKKALINTSFNLHNNPIIESTDVAIRSWLTSDTDVLVIGNTIIEKVVENA